MRWPDLYPCGWSLAVHISTVIKNMMSSGGPPGQRGFSLLTYEIGWRLAKWLQVTTTVSLALRYQVKTTILTLEIRYSERHSDLVQVSACPPICFLKGRKDGQLGQQSGCFQRIFGAARTYANWSEVSLRCLNFLNWEQSVLGFSPKEVSRRRTSKGNSEKPVRSLFDSGY